MTDLARPATYRTFDEVEETLSPAEQRFERLRRTVGLAAGPAVALVVYLLCSGLDEPAQKLAGILSLVIVWWMTEAIPIPVTAMLALALTVVLGVAPAEEVFALFGNSTVFVFIGGFVLAESMRKHGLDQRFAYRVLSIPGVASSTVRVIVAFGLISAGLSAFVSNTASAAMLMPIAMGIIGFLAGRVSAQSDEDTDTDDVRRLRFSTALLLMVAYGASVGGLLTPVGSPTNLIGRELITQETGEEIPFFTWMLLAFPVVAIMFVALCVVLLRLNRPETKRIEGAEEFVREKRSELGAMTRADATPSSPSG